MVSGSPEFGERTTRSEVRRVEASTKQQTNFFGNHENAPVGRGGGDSYCGPGIGPNARRWDSSDWQCGNSTSRRKNFCPGGRNYRLAAGKDSEPKRSRTEMAMERNIPICGLNGKPGQGGVDSRPAALVRETDRNGNGTVRGLCSGRASRRDCRVGTEQSEFPETPTGSDGKGHLHDSDGSKTLKTIFAVW